MMNKEDKNYVEEMKKISLRRVSYDCSISRFNNELDALEKSLGKKVFYLRLRKIE